MEEAVSVAPKLNVVLDFSKWTYSELSQYVNQIQRGGDLAVLFDLAAKVVVSNNWGINPSSEDPFGELSLEDSHAFLLVIAEQVGKVVENAKSLPVDLHWNTRRYIEWQRVVRLGDPLVIQKWMREVVDFNEPKIEDLPELNAVQGALGMRSIAEAYSRKISGKR